MGRRLLSVLAVLALLSVANTDAFSPNRMEGLRIHRQYETQLAAAHHSSSPTTADALVKTFAGIMTAGLLLFSSPLPSLADGSRLVGELKGSGLVFKVSNLV